MSEHCKTPKELCFTIIALGSAGDIYPLLAIAISLKQSGYNVAFLSSPEMATQAQKYNLPFYPICSAEDLERTLSHPRLWEARAGLGVLWRYLGVPALKPTLTLLKLRLLSHPQATHIVLASAIALGARIAREIYHFHLITAYTSPANLRQIEGPFFIGDVAIPTWFPRKFKSFIWQLLDRHKLDPMIRTGIEKVRQEMKLSPLKGGYLKNWMHSPDTGIALWPRWFDQTKHFGQYQAPLQTGFIFLDLPEDLSLDQTLSQSLENFLATGPSPIVWMPGSAVRDPQAFFEKAVKVSQSLGCRALLLTSDIHYQPTNLPRGCLVHPLVSFTQLLPRCQALVHHGGIGSAAAAIRAGIPQLIIASAFDQFFNGHRIEVLKLGVWCKSTQANSVMLEKKLLQALKLSQQEIHFFQNLLLKTDVLDLTCNVIKNPL